VNADKLQFAINWRNLTLPLTEYFVKLCEWIMQFIPVTRLSNRLRDSG